MEARFVSDRRTRHQLVKVKVPGYTQAEGRHELFESRRSRVAPAPIPPKKIDAASPRLAVNGRATIRALCDITPPKGVSVMTGCALVLALLTLGAFNASAQTDAKRPSMEGTWKLDLAKSSFRSEPALKSVTVTILKDTPDLISFRVDDVNAEGEPSSYSWSGPVDGSLHPVKDSKGQDLMLQEGVTRDKDGAVLRHGVFPTGSTFDGRATLSADGNTITDLITYKTTDGKTSKETWVFQRVTASK